MRVLLVHNFYQHPGGEGRVFAEEEHLLRAHGHHVVRYTVHNDEVRQHNPLALAQRTVWNGHTYRALKARVREERIEIAHFHNTLPLISPAAYYAAHRSGAAVIQTLHNYRLLCPGALFLRDGSVCEDCLGRAVAWPGVRHKCYRDSRAATTAVTGMLATHRLLGTWTRQVDTYITMTEFERAKFIEGGLPEHKIVVKPHFAQAPLAPGDRDEGYVLFVGRLSAEKGILTLLRTWKDLHPPAPLKIIGDGPLAGQVQEAASSCEAVTWLGRKKPEEVLALMRDAALVVVPSECYETFGRVVIEAFSVGTPVVTAGLGAVAELVEHGRTGRLFQAGSATDLAAQLGWMLSHVAARRRMGRRARATYEARYTPERNYRMLWDIYHAALHRPTHRAALPA